MAILQAQLKKQLNTLLPSAANSINMNRLGTWLKGISILIHWIHY